MGKFIVYRYVTKCDKGVTNYAKIYRYSINDIY